MNQDENFRVESQEGLFGPHGGYRELVTFKLARLIYDATVLFCDRFLERNTRTKDQMTQAARSGVQNIAEGSEACATSRKTELKLTGVARASLEELRLDYEDFLRQHALAQWPAKSPLRRAVSSERFGDADALFEWSQGLATREEQQTKNRACTPAWATANTLLVLVEVCTALLKRQMDAQSRQFLEQGGFTERLFKTRLEARTKAK